VRVDPDQAEWEREAWRLKDAERYYENELNAVFLSIVGRRTEADMSIRAAGKRKHFYYYAEAFPPPPLILLYSENSPPIRTLLVLAFYMYLSNNPLWRFAGVLERLAYTVTSDSVVGQRNSSAIGYEFSVLPKFVLKVAKLEVEVLRWEGASAEQAAAQAWRSKVVSEMLTVRQQQYSSAILEIQRQQELVVLQVEGEFRRLKERSGVVKVSIVPARVVMEDEEVHAYLNVEGEADEDLERMWKDSYWSELGIRRPRDAPESETSTYPSLRLKDHQLRSSASAFNMYAFKAFNAAKAAEGEASIAGHNSQLTQGWLRKQDVHLVLTGTRKQVQRVAKANGLPSEVVAEPQTKCDLCGEAPRGGKYVRCRTIDGDGCGRRYCEKCVLLGLQPPLRPCPEELLTTKWLVSRMHFLCSPLCAAEASVIEVEQEVLHDNWREVELTDAERNEILENEAAMDDEAWDELYWDDYAARVEAEEQDADWGDTEDDLWGPSVVLDDDGRDGWCTDDPDIEVAYTWNMG
jgi:hypothetical protein